MRTWVKVTLGGVALVAVVVLALAGVGAYFVLGNMNKRDAGEAEALRDIDAIRARFGARPPLVEIVDPRRADIRINRLQNTAGTRVATVHIINWNADSGELIRTEAPLWLMRFSSVNLLSQLGVAPARFTLTVADIERYGPGIVVDHGVPGSVRVLVWVD
ncbi:MAG: hypothetical protein A3H96_07595 [Acidobacteria bacterium RIFCSPLOWO2_02_FULL_67_36]|nr:MAG: hypothetical protein A3H96_07595 [Acidobacteria bacterium RIFCSPLOWO2_02_FULL_67_36]OFW23626.1 MAG: hypothetical protein A3G21_06825 [Acidobacteria bacterium RIFCSPLOWO2_12_FULL_66_21]